MTSSENAAHSVRTGAAPLERTPDHLVPKAEDYPATDHTLLRKAVLFPSIAGDPLDDPKLIDGPLDLIALTDQDGGVDEPMVGAVVTHSQQWTRSGMALGNLLHSLALAPGEATRVAIEDWTHRTTGTGTEDTSQGETSSAAQSQARALQDVQDSVATESQHGFSMNAASATSHQAGVSMFGISASTSRSSSLATAVSMSDGTRHLGAKENQELHESAQQHAQTTRTRRASVVREVNESDAARASTRIVANYNHMHALTVQYFEVVEVYDVKTKVNSAEPCIFVPLELAKANDLLETFPSIIANAAEAVGMDRLALAIRTMPGEEALATDTPTVKDGVAAAKAALAASVDQLHKLEPDLTKSPSPAQGWFLYNEMIRNARGTIAGLQKADKSLDDLLAAQADVKAKLVRRIDEFKEYFNQSVWLHALTPRMVRLLLKDRVYGGELLNDIVDPQPVAITGNLVGFRVSDGKWPAGLEETPELDNDRPPLSSSVAVPTGGVFAEAVLGQAVSAERIDLTRFWNWHESPIPMTPSDVKPADLAHQPTGIDTKSGQLRESAAPLRAPTPLPEPVGLSSLIQALGKSEIFRNMSGLDAAKEIALAAANHAAHGTDSAAENATASYKAGLEFAEKVVPMILTDGASTVIGGMSNMGSDNDAEPTEGDNSATAE